MSEDSAEDSAGNEGRGSDGPADHEGRAPHPTADFADIVHQPNRLGILVILREAGRADFRFLRESLALTDGNLGRHLDALEQAGLVELTKGFEGRRSRTWAQLTPAGKQALGVELSSMRRLLRRMDS